MPVQGLGESDCAQLKDANSSNIPVARSPPIFASRIAAHAITRTRIHPPADRKARHRNKSRDSSNAASSLPPLPEVSPILAPHSLALPTASMTDFQRYNPWHLLQLLALAAMAATVSAQCEPEWLPGDGVRGVDGYVNEMVAWDPDGVGPLAELIVMVGEFQTAGSIRASNVVGYDRATKTWTAFGDGVDGEAVAAVVMPNGNLVVSGEFFHAGGVAASGVAKWDGNSWAPLGTGVNDVIHAMVVLPNGDLLAGGDFTTAGGIPVDYLAQWNGSNWFPTAAGLNNRVRSLAVLSNGHVAVGGRFDQAAGLTVNGIAEWDGVAWSALDHGVRGDPNGNGVETMLVHPSGDLYVGGAFRIAGSLVAYGVARWDGVSWHAVGSASYVQDLTLSNSGNVIAGGYSFSTVGGGPPAQQFGEWDGSAWTPLASSTSSDGSWADCVFATAGGDVFVGGRFTYIGSSSQSHRGVAVIQGGQVRPLADGANEGINAVMELDNGDVLVAGAFRLIGGIAARRVARWDGMQWHALGQGQQYTIPYDVTQLPTGEPVLVGNFQYGPVETFNGTWAPLGFLGVTGDGYAGIRWQDGIAIGGSLQLGGQQPPVAYWNGTTWSSLGGTLAGYVNALAATADGGLVAGGSFTSSSGPPIQNIARWNGSSWEPLGPGLNGIVHAVASLANGDIVAGGAFTYAGSTYTSNIARWDGAAWHAMGFAGLSHRVDTLATLPNGDLIAGGQFLSAGGLPTKHIARWNGSSWSSLGAGANGNVRALAASSRGVLYVGGEFVGAGTTGSAFFARYASTCPASAVSYGTGCGVLAGSDSLLMLDRPWLGATFRSQADGLPANSLAVGITGLSTATLPLSNILPQALSGCQLLLTPDMLDLYLPSAGEIEPTLSIPNVAALAGQMLHHQVVAIELNAQASIVAAHSSNALTLTIGSF
jgi:trimeric autotransporter adhesin